MMILNSVRYLNNNACVLLGPGEQFLRASPAVPLSIDFNVFVPPFHVEFAAVAHPLRHFLDWHRLPISYRTSRVAHVGYATSHADGGLRCGCFIRLLSGKTPDRFLNDQRPPLATDLFAERELFVAVADRFPTIKPLLPYLRSPPSRGEPLRRTWHGLSLRPARKPRSNSPQCGTTFRVPSPRVSLLGAADSMG